MEREPLEIIGTGFLQADDLSAVPPNQACQNTEWNSENCPV